jgi:glycogen(starch) synthase
VLRSLDVLLLPSVYEELGSVLVEAMATGLPVVAARVGGIPEVVEHRQTGLLLTPEDETDWAQAVGDLLADEATRSQMAVAAADRASAYAWPALAKRVHHVYEQVLDGGGARACRK